jgi:phage shock protein C
VADRLYRSRDERMFGGVAGGIAEEIDVDPTLVRIAWVVFALLTGGAALLVYFALLFVIPEEPEMPAGEPAPAGSTTAAGVPPGTAPDRTAARTAREARREARRADRAARGADRSRSGGLLVGGLLVAVGVWFLVRRYIPQLDTNLLWPLVLVLLGVVLIVVALRPGGRSGD